MFNVFLSSSVRLSSVILAILCVFQSYYNMKSWVDCERLTHSHTHMYENKLIETHTTSIPNEMCYAYTALEKAPMNYKPSTIRDCHLWNLYKIDSTMMRIA